MTVYVKRVKVQRSVLLQKTMILPLIFCSILFLIVIVECFRKKAVKFTLPPGPKKLPFIGNLHQLAGSQLPHHRLSELMNQYGPVMHVQMGELSVVVISDPESAKEVLKNQDPNFAAKAPFVVSEMMNFDNSSLVFAPYGEYWRQMRKIVVLELLSAKRVRSYRFIREKETQILIDQIASTCGSIVNLSEKTAYYTASVFCKTAFGEDFNVNQQKELIELLRETIDLAGGFNLAEIYPSIKVFRHIHGLKRKMNLLRGKMNDMFDDILSNHKNKRDHNNNTSCSSTLQDLVDVFLRIQESNDMGISVTTNNIKGVIRDLFGAGTETSSVTLEWVMSELLKNPTVMNKAQTEVREVLNLKGKKHIEESDVEELKYLKLVIKETLRLHPPGPLFPREARQNCKINGYDVPAKTRILVNLWAIGRDPRYWSNPDKFEPQRFVDSSVDFNGSHFHLLPFGAGKRMCPGIVFATASMEMVLAALLYHFDWKLPNGRNFEDLDMEEARGAHSNRQNNLCVIATKMH